MIPSVTLQPYNTKLPPSEDFEEARRFEEAINKPLAVLEAFEKGESLHLTKEHLFEVAIACAQKNVAMTAASIKHFCLTENQRLDLAIACAQKDVAMTASFIKNFCLTENQLSELAMACVQQNSQVLTMLIKDFCLTEPHRLEMAMACARKNGWVTAENIQNFCLTNQEQLFKVAIACAQEDAIGTAKYIQNFCLTDQEQLFKVAIACTQQHGRETAGFIQNFCLTDQEHLFKAAIACAQQNGRGTAESIRNFCLTDQEHLFKAAMACAQQHGGGTAEFIRKFGLTDQEQLFQVAITCAQQNGETTAEFIQNFCLTEEQRFKVAIACTKEDNRVMTLYIPNFDLDEEHRFEIAKISSKLNGWRTLACIHAFSLNDPAQFFEILTLAILQDPWSLRFIPNGISPFKQILDNLRYHGSPSEIIDRLLVLAPPGLNISQLASFLRNIEALEQQREAIALIIAALFVYSTTLSFEQLEWVSKNKFLDEILALKAPYLRIKLIRLVKETASSSHFDQIPGKLPLLLKLPMAKLLAQGVDLASLKFNKHALKDSAVLIPFLEAMIEIADNEILLPDQKTAVIEAMSQKPFDLARDLLIILNFCRSDLLQTSLQRGLPTLAEEAFRSVLPLPQQVKDFSNCYKSTFGSYRQKNALKTYAAKLNKAADHRIALEALGAHVASVLNHTYAEDRYSPKNNPHLQFLKNHHPAILQAWQKNSKPQPLQDVLKSDQPTSASPSMRDWLREKLIADRHLDLNDYPSLEQLLGDDPEPARNSLIEQSKKNSKSPSIDLQLKCYALSKSSAEENTLRLLREIELLAPPSEFQNDVKAKIASLTKSQNLADLTIVETDDPEDLLLCGTEIRGSCQRVDGDPSLNRGLVGYLLNGQTRMIAVKDKTGRLAARCLLRLLVDKEGKPVLFLERFYSNLNDPRLHTAIIAKAKQTADRLLCPLTSLEGETAYGPLRSLGGPAPWEYVDGASGVQESEYTINNPKLLYNPGKE